MARDRRRRRADGRARDEDLPRGRAPLKLQLDVEIARPPEEVFDYLVEPANLPAWQESCVAVEPLGDGRWRETRSFMGRSAEVETEVVERELPRVFAVRSAGGPVTFAVRHELEPSGDGTRVRVEAEGEAPGGRLGAGIAKRLAERQFRSDFERLKSILESDPDASARAVPGV